MGRKESNQTRPRALIFSMSHDLVDLYQTCSNYARGAKNGTAPGVTYFKKVYKGEKLEKILSESIRHKALIFGM